MEKPIPDNDPNYAPICLPGGDLFPDMYKNATVVGMGWRWEPKRECNTVAGGPSEFSPCKFPFIDHNGHKVKSMLISCLYMSIKLAGCKICFLIFQQFNCPKTSTPSSNETVCREFYDNYVTLRRNEFPERYEVEIKISGTENKTYRCFDNKAYHHGKYNQNTFLIKTSFLY